MRIYAMQATFGKLEHATLQLQPGLNILHAPNEWGKSTWCALLLAMFYGLDTRDRSSKTALADKERYAPWSGAPMSGRIDLNFQGQDITIERGPKGRVPLGEFKAYDTASGLPIHTLTAANCGQVLLGAEKSVFLRSAFLRLADLPVTQDADLLRRLNALVTTGDESGQMARLQQQLKELKNKCSRTRTGLLPQAQAQYQELSRQLQQLEEQEARSRMYRQEQALLQQQADDLRNHLDALQYAAAREGQQVLQEARAALEQARERLEKLEEICAALPEPEEADAQLQKLQQLLRQGNQLKQQLDALPSSPAGGPDPETARQDYTAWCALKKKAHLWLLLPALAGAAAMLQPSLRLPGMLTALLALALCLAWGLGRRNKAAAIAAAYAPLAPELWQETARQLAAQQVRRQELQQALSAWTAQLQQLTGGQPAKQWAQRWQQIAARHSALAQARQTLTQKQEVYDAAAGAARQAPPPAREDTLTAPEDATRHALEQTQLQLQQAAVQLGQCLGQMAQLGSRETLQAALARQEAAITRLQQADAALELGIRTLEDAAAQLQQRFAPKITSRAQALFRSLTLGRYDRLTLSRELQVEAGSSQEDTLRSALWRSDGTADQLYIALRLAVAEVLLPESPLVLDDVLVRFDAQRRESALQVLRDLAQTRQVLLFTCQKLQ